MRPHGRLNLSIGVNTPNHEDIGNILPNDHINNLTDITTRLHSSLQSIGENDHHNKPSDLVYSALWDTNLDPATKNAIYDKLEAIQANLFDYGTYTGNGAGAGKEIVVDFTPRTLLLSDTGGHGWFKCESMSGWYALAIQVSYSDDLIDFISGGFAVKTTCNTNGTVYYWSAFYH